MKKIALIPCVMLLSACSLITDYRRPDMSVPTDWPDSSPSEAKLPEVVEKPASKGVAWKEFFTDATLQNLIQKALDNNGDLRVAALNIEVARASYRVTEADFLPKVDAGMSGSGQRTSRDLSQSMPKECSEYTSQPSCGTERIG